MSPTPASELFDHFRIELDAGDKPLFRGGERITGTVKLQLKREVTIQVIRIQFKGRAVQKDTKKGRDVEKIFFDKDFVLLERPPGKPEPGNFEWKANFEYSLPFQYILPLGCPSSFESPDGFVRYFARVTFETAESNSPVYVSKKHFSVYDLDTVAAIDPRFQEPYTYRHTFTSGGCCCKRHVYMEFVMPKRVYYAGEDIQARLLIDNISDERIANDIEYNIVERTTKPDVDEDEALKYPARVIRSGQIDGQAVEKNRSQITIGSLVIPEAAPASHPNAVALASLPKDKSSPQLSPDDNASKLFEHPSILSQPSKEPVFRIHYALQILIGKFLIEVPFVVRPVDSEEVRNFIKRHASDTVRVVDAQVPEKRLASKDKAADHFVEPDEHDMIIVGDQSTGFVPVVPVYATRPADEQEYKWPELGTFDSKGKLVWHPDKKPPTKQERSEQARREKEAKKEEARLKSEQRAQQKKAKKQEKKSEKELLITTAEPQHGGDEQPHSLSVNVESVTIENRLTPVQSEIITQPHETSTSTAVEQQQPQSSAEQQPAAADAAAAPEEAKPTKKELAERKKQEKLEQKRLKEDQKRAEKEAKLEKARAKEAEKREREQAKISEKQAKKEEAERKKQEAAHAKEEAKRQAKLNKKHKKDTEEQLLVEEANAEAVPGTSEEKSAVIVESVTETVIHQQGDAPPEVTTTQITTEKTEGGEPITTTVEVVTNNEKPAIPEPQPITEEIVVVTHEAAAPAHEQNDIQPNGHHSPPAQHENGTGQQQVNGGVELNGHHNHVEEEGAGGDHVASLKASAAAADAQAAATEENAS